MRLEHEFVDYIPDDLVDGRLYVSVRFGTVVHLCACGCGEEVVTPLGPSEWKMVFDGVSISLEPSIGNWGFRCRSHYWIDRSEIRWARSFDVLEVERVRKENKERRDMYFARNRELGSPTFGTRATMSPIARLYRRTVRWLSARKGGRSGS